MNDRISLLIRADANPQIGTGHIVRCLALAEVWRDFGENVIFIMRDNAPGLETRLKEKGFNFRYISAVAGTDEDAKTTLAIASEMNADWIVIDGYQFSGAFVDFFTQAGISALSIDDYGHADHYSADIILNQNVYADASFYPHVETGTELLLGTRYVLLRKEFRERADRQREIASQANKILVTLGGGDPHNATLMVIDAICQIDAEKLEVIIVAGAANPHISLLRDCVQQYPFMKLKENVESMPDLMAWADIAISGGGSTCWELAFMGVPNIIIVIADNQLPVADALQNMGIAESLGYFRQTSSEKIQSMLLNLLGDRKKRSLMSEKAQQLIDGDGACRVTISMQKKGFQIRLASADDCTQLFTWANDRQVRKFSFHPEPISWETHVKWFNQKISDPDCKILIMTTRHGHPVGQIRFDREGVFAEVDVSVDPQYRACGIGSWLIQQGVQFYIREVNNIGLSAWIKKENISSIRAFQNAGFKLNASGNKYGCEVVQVLKSAHK